MAQEKPFFKKYAVPIALVVVLVLAVVAFVIFFESADDGDEVIDNEAPIAVAGGDTVVVEGQPVLLDASNSSDPDDDELEFFWDVDSQVDSDGDGDEANDHDLEGEVVTHTYMDKQAGDVVVVTLMVSDGQEESIDTIQITVVDASDGMPPEVLMTVTYGDPIGLVADPHYIILVDGVSRLESISDFSYEIKDDEDNIILAGDLEEILGAGLNETVRYVDLTTSTEGLGMVSEGDSILIRDTIPIEEGHTFHLKYRDMETDAGMVTLLKDLVP